MTTIKNRTIALAKNLHIAHNLSFFSLAVEGFVDHYTHFMDQAKTLINLEVSFNLPTKIACIHLPDDIIAGAYQVVIEAKKHAKAQKYTSSDERYMQSLALLKFLHSKNIITDISQCITFARETSDLYE